MALSIRRVARSESDGRIQQHALHALHTQIAVLTTENQRLKEQLSRAATPVGSPGPSTPSDEADPLGSTVYRAPALAQPDDGTIDFSLQGMPSRVLVDARGVPTMTSLPAILDRLESDLLHWRSEGMLLLARLVNGVEGEVAQVIGEYLRETGGFEVLIDLLGETEIMLLQRALMVLGNLSSEAFDGKADATRKLLGEHGAAKQVLRCTEAADTETVLFAVAALQNMCKDEDFAADAMKQGAAEALERLLKTVALRPEQPSKRPSANAVADSSTATAQAVGMPTASYNQRDLLYHYASGCLMNLQEAASASGVRQKKKWRVVAKFRPMKSTSRGQETPIPLGDESQRALGWRKDLQSMSSNASEAVAIQLRQMSAQLDRYQQGRFDEHAAGVAEATRAQVREAVRVAIQHELAAAQESFHDSFAEYGALPQGEPYSYSPMAGGPGASGPEGGMPEGGVRRHSWMHDVSAVHGETPNAVNGETLSGERPRSRGIAASIAASLGSPFSRSVAGASSSTANTPRAAVPPPAVSMAGSATGAAATAVTATGARATGASLPPSSAVVPYVNEEALCERLSSSMAGVGASPPSERDVEMGLSLAALDDEVEDVELVPASVIEDC